MMKTKYTEEQLEQKRKARKFSVPYNNEDPEYYIEKVIDPYINNIDNVYFEIPNGCLYNHCNVSAHRDINEFFNLQTNTFRFARLIADDDKYKHIKRYVTFNGASYTNHSVFDKYVFVGNYVREFINAYSITGVICSDLELARCIHNMYPEIEIQTSCNTYIWIPRMVQMWRDELGIKVHNPPREIMRNFEQLKYLRKHVPDIKLKCLVNEMCIYGCPQNINHAHYIANDNWCNHESYCTVRDWTFADLFKTNIILPRWLKYYDDYVDVFKLTSRQFDTDRIAFTLDAYVNERDDVRVGRLFSSSFWPRVMQCLKENFNMTIKLSDIPDYLMTCACEKCDTGCKVCQKAADRILKRYGVTTEQVDEAIRQCLRDQSR